MIRKYPCNREYEKIIRYNGNWFKLKSIFDDDAGVSNFDFNQEIENDELFDFNKVLDLTNNQEQKLSQEDDIEQNDEHFDFIDPIYDIDYTLDNLLN